MIHRQNKTCYMKRIRYSSTILFFLPFLLSILSLSANGQEERQKITGTVIGSDRSPLVGAAVKIKSRTIGTTTDEHGKFSINALPTDTIVISYINYVTQFVRVGAKVNIPINLVEAATNMNEVIVIGYGTIKRKELTGVVGKVNMEDLRKAPVTSFDQALAGRIAGVTVSTNDGQPGGGSQIVIRGSSAGQDVSPLYVVDGFPIENLDFNSINTNDIESIEVLKDASSIAIYGSRGANGVIMITTKKGKAEPLKITYTGSEGFSNPTKLMSLLSPYEFVKLQLELDSIQSTPTVWNITEFNRYIGHTNKFTGLLDTIHPLDYYKTVKGYDWQRMLIQTGLLQTHNLSLIGGTPDMRYAINGSYINQKGVIINTGLKKYDGKVSLDSKVSDRTRIGGSLNYSNTTSYGTIPTSGPSGGVVSSMWSFRPVDILGGANLDNGTIDSSQISNGTTVPDNLVNPRQQALNEYRQSTTKTTTLNTYLDYKITDELHFRITGGISNTSLHTESFNNSKTSGGTLALNASGVPFNQNGLTGSLANTNNNNYISESTLSYRKMKDRNHIIDAVGGFTYSYGKSNGNGYSVIQIPQALEGLGVGSLGYGTPTKVGYYPTQNKMYSMLGRVNYSLMEKYIFTLTGRQDGTSRFAAGHQWGFFPSSAFAWRFSREQFMQNHYFHKLASVLTDGKLRVSYGFVGNNRVGDYSSLYQMAFGTSAGYPVNNVNTLGAIPYFIGNKTLTWETTGQLDIGTTLSFLSDRILIDMDYYDKNTRNSLLAVPVPVFTGYNVGSTLQYQNAGVIRNRGFEFSLTTTNIRKNNFTWTSTFNIAFNKNKLLRFYAGIDTKQTSWNLSQSATAWITREGYPISQFYGYKWGGVYQYNDFNKLANGSYVLKSGLPTFATNSTTPVQPGDPKYVDLNGDGVISDADRTVIGNPLPVHTGGFTNDFIYKNFSLNILFQWSYGNQVLNANKLVFDGGYYPTENQFADYANRWTPSNPSNNIPRFTGKGNGSDPDGLTRVSSRLVEDASFLRLKTINLSYNMPSNLVKRVGVSSLRFFISAQNLFTWTKYSGLDPEVSTYRGANPSGTPFGVSGGNALAGVGYSYVQPSSGSAALAQGLDYTAYPRNKVYTLGAVVTF